MVREQPLHSNSGYEQAPVSHNSAKKSAFHDVEASSTADTTSDS